MTDPERDLYLDLSWFSTSESTFLGRSLRPLSLMSYQAAKLMGLRLLERVDQTAAELQAEMEVWVWLHSAPIPEIGEALWTGSWRAIPDPDEPPLPTVIAEFLDYRERLRLMVEASGVRVLPRPRSESDKTPSHVVGPRDLAFTISSVSEACNESLHFIRWEMPLQQAMQLHHARLRWQGAWTARLGTEVRVEEFDDFAVSDLGDAWQPPSAADLAEIDGS